MTQKAAVVLFLAGVLVISGSQAQCEWRRAPGILPIGGFSAAAYDPNRSELLVYQALGPPLPAELWAWTGTRWVERQAPGARPQDSGLLALDVAAGAVLLVTMGRLVNETWRWTGSQWQMLAPFQTPTGPRLNFRLATDWSRRRVVLFGGQAWGSTVNLNDIWEWDGTSWTAGHPGGTGAGVPTSRLHASLTYDPSSAKVILAGGVAISTTLRTDSWAWDGVLWTRVGDLPIGLALQEATPDFGTGRIVLYGGMSSGWGGPTLNQTLKFVGSSWARVATVTSPRPLQGPGLAYDPRSGVTLVGGYGGGNMPNDNHGEVWLYQPATRAWVERTEGLSPRAINLRIAAWFPPRRSVVTFDPEEPGIPGGMCEWDGARWSRLAVPNLPPVTQPGMAWHAASRKLVLFGGLLTVPPYLPSRDTWEWDGISWTMRPAGTTPPGWSQMVEDRARGQLLMYVGRDTWTWDGSAWSLRGPASPPGYRAQPCMAYDSDRGVVVLYGNPYPRTQQDIWEWDGSQWSQNLAVTGPPMRLGSMVYDEQRRVMVLNMYSAVSGQAEVWEYDIVSWRQVLAGGPTFTNGYALVYDPQRRNILLSGGVVQLSAGSWWLEPGTWLYGPKSLSPAAQELPTGSTVSWSLDLPRDASLPFFCGLSLGCEDGIPLGQSASGATTLWPLKADRLFGISLGFSSLMGVLDPAGRGNPSLSLPNDPNLAGLLFHASAVTLGPALQVRSITPNVITYIRH